MECEGGRSWFGFIVIGRMGIEDYFSGGGEDCVVGGLLYVYVFVYVAFFLVKYIIKGEKIKCKIRLFLGSLRVRTVSIFIFIFSYI